MEFVKTHPTPIIIILIGFLLGIIFSLFLFRILRNRIFIFRSLEKWTFLIFLITSIYIAIKYIDIAPKFYPIVEKSILFLIIIIITIIIAQIVVNIIISYQSRIKDVLPSTSLFSNLIRILIYIIGILIALDSIGISITPIIATLGIGGIAIALALQDTLSNLFAGIYISVSRMVRIGDYIKLDNNQEGYVVDITWRNTIILSSNNYIIIPNSKLAQSIIVNYSMPNREVLFSISVSILPDNDLEKVEKITFEIAREVISEIEGAIKSFEPIIRFVEISDNKIKLSITFKVLEFQYKNLLTHEFIKRLIEKYKEEGVRI